jgi:hypothetical protein
VPHREQLYARPERNLLSKRHNSFPADVSVGLPKFKLRHYPTRLPLANPANFCENNSLSYPCQKD